MQLRCSTSAPLRPLTATFNILIHRSSQSHKALSSSIDAYLVRADNLGKNGEQGREVTADVARLIPVLETYIGKSALLPVPCMLYNYEGWAGLIDAMGRYTAKPPSTSIIVKVQET